MGDDRIFKELTPECDITARLYAQGYEKKEIANMKCRAVSTINNQLQKAFDILHVRNGRELARLLYERLTGIKFSMNYSPAARTFIACCFLVIFSFSIYQELNYNSRETRLRRIELRTRRFEND